MDLEEYEELLFKAIDVDWKKMKRIQNRLKKLLDEGRSVRIYNKDSDLTFSIEGRKALKFLGKMNLPDGEVLIAPLENTVNGHIKFDFSKKGGNEVEEIYLEFKDGRVINAFARRNERFLKAMLNVDEGAKYIGEFGIGTNFNIANFTTQTILDEKIAGTIHIALGYSYRKSGGRNKSAIHWDFVKDLRKGGALFIDNQKVDLEKLCSFDTES
jgi:aminopeptidase